VQLLSKELPELTQTEGTILIEALRASDTLAAPACSEFSQLCLLGNTVCRTPQLSFI